MPVGLDGQGNGQLGQLFMPAVDVISRMRNESVDRSSGAAVVIAFIENVVDR